MTMKQTQTKYYEMSDIGLDFNSGSKAIFPDRFKKMLAQGYNEQTVSSVAVTGNQVVLTYGVSHGYVANRVLKITSGSLTAINNGEFYIDSVTTNTVTLTIDNAPLSVAGGFITKIASLGWELLYEQAFIHVYKFKHIDNTDMYARFVFQSNTGSRNTITPCVGKSYDAVTGFITDEYALNDNKAVLVSNTGFRFEISREVNTTHINQNYAQGASNYGHAGAIGSPYHFVFSFCGSNAAGYQMLNGILPVKSIGYPLLDYPLMIGYQIGTASSTTNYSNPDVGLSGYIGSTKVILVPNGTNLLGTGAIATQGVLPSNIDEFNTTTCAPVLAWDTVSRQFIGVVMGVLEPRYIASNKPTRGTMDVPKLELEADYGNYVVLMHNSNNWLALPIEEVRDDS